MAQLDINPPADNASGPELTPLGQLGQQQGSDPSGDAKLLAAAVLEGASGETRTAVPYNDMSKGAASRASRAKRPMTSTRRPASRRSRLSGLPGPRLSFGGALRLGMGIGFHRLRGDRPGLVGTVLAGRGERGERGAGHRIGRAADRRTGRADMRIFRGTHRSRRTVQRIAGARLGRGGTRLFLAAALGAALLLGLAMIINISC